jgi:2-dehydropantoate 2-reductase
VTAGIAVLGLGGVGGMVAARTGALCVGTERTVEVIRAAGVRLVHGATTTIARPEAVTRLDRPVSLLVVAVKAYALDDALDRIAPEAIRDALVLPLLNGLEHVDAMRARLRAHAVAAGSIAGVEAYSPEPGVVVLTTPGATITAAADELGRERLEAMVEPLRVPGVEVVVRESERVVLWEKAVRLAVLAAAAVASGRPVGELRTDDAWRRRLRAALAEACAVADADGVALDVDEQWAIIESLPHDMLPSAARDMQAGRPTEIDAITGSVARAGTRLGVWTPMLDGLLADATRHAERVR